MTLLCAMGHDLVRRGSLINSRRSRKKEMLRTYLVVGAALCVSAMRFSTLKIKLEDGRDLELSARDCKAGVYFPVRIQFHCACVTGMNYCEEPVAIIGGRDYCFHFKAGAHFSYVVPIGDTVYSLKPSLSHFKEDFQLLTKSYVERKDGVNFEPCASLLMVTGVNETSWTMRGNKGESVCLKSKGPDRYCRFNMINSSVCSWETVRGISPGCADDARSVIFSNDCHRMVVAGRNVSGECSAIPGNDDEISEEKKATSTVGYDNATVSRLDSTTGSSVDNATGAFEVSENSRESSTTEYMGGSEETTPLSISESMAPPFATCTPPSRADAAASNSATFWTPSEGACMHRYGWAELKSSLRRFSLRKLSELFPKEGKTMMEQVGEIVKIHGSLVERLCGKHLVSAELIAELAKWFLEILEEDLFGNTDRLDGDLFGRIKSSLKECVDEAREIKFDEFLGHCDCMSIRDHVFLNGIKKPIHVPPEEAWVNYEILIESGWKMFTAAHAYCYSKFSRKNDHHSYSHHILQLFGNKIYDKWTRANNAANHELYSAILGSKCLITSLNNLDKCVGGIGHFSEISLWIDRGSATRSKPFVRKKRETWKNQILQNREESFIWDKSGYCLQTPEDAGYKLGFGVCGD